MSKASSKATPALEAQTDPGLFAWVKPAFHSRRSMKTWIRCCVAFAATVVLLVSRKTSDTMGQAAFFCVIVSVMLPPSLALSVYLVAAFTVLLGMLVGWAWGNAAMAAALAARSSTLLMQQKQKLGSIINPDISIPLQTQIFTFHGNFLDVRSSTVYGAFLFVGAFALGALRAYLPNLTVLSLFATIVLDVICTVGPLLPTANYTLAKLFLLPTTFYLAIAIGSLVLVFPESLSHVWVTSLREDFWNHVAGLLHLQSETLRLTPSDADSWAKMYAKGVNLREVLVGGLPNITSQIKLINVDTSIGRLGPSDLKRINSELKSVMFRANGLHSFTSFVNDINLAEARDLEVAADDSNLAAQTPQAPNRFRALLTKTKEQELKHGHDLDSLVPILEHSSANLRNSAEVSVHCVIDWLQDCNSHRLTGLFRRKDPVKIQQRQKLLTTQLKELEDALEEFRSVERAKLIKPYEKFFDPETKHLMTTNRDTFAARSLYICFVFIDTLDAFAERMIDVLKIIIDIDAQRPTVKIWFPGRISTIKSSITGNDFQNSSAPLGMGVGQDPAVFDSASRRNDSDSTLNVDEEEEEEDWEKMEFTDREKRTKDGLADAPKKRNPDAVPPKTAVGRSLLKLAPIFRFFKSPEGLLALRHAIVSIALWIPAVCPSTAWFYYDNKGIWALIMAQTGLAMYAGDQIAGFIIRFTGTILGLIVGMAVWYIGAGLGHGNPYGIVVASTVAIAPLLLSRIAAPPSHMPFYLMTSITIVFVAGYSWVNANQFILANTGTGVSIGWKRALLVIIGFTAAFIVMLFPNPISSRVLVRKTLAAVGSEVGNIFAGEIEAFLAEERRARLEGDIDAHIDPDTRRALLKEKEKRIRKIGRRVIVVATRLRFIEPSLTTAKFEPQFAGTWPHEIYTKLFTLQMRMMAALGLLTISFSKLNAKWCGALVHRTPYLNPNFLSDVFMTITILSNALMGGHALPAYLPKLRDRLVYHEYHSGGSLMNPPAFRSATSPLEPRKMDNESLDTDSSPDENTTAPNRKLDLRDEEEISRAAGPTNVDGTTMGLEGNQITLDILFNEQLPAYSTAIVAFSSLVSRIDEMSDVVRTLCGEATFGGYETLHQDYLDREERNIGGVETRFASY